jgi:hypothetical protein
MSAVEIHRELCVADGQNVMSERTIRQWCGMFKDRRTHVQDEEQSDQPSVVMILFSVHQKIPERRFFTISDLSCEFTQISRTVLCKIITG